MKRLCIVMLLFAASSSHAQSREIRDSVLRKIIAMHSGPNFAIVSARLRLGRDTDLAYRQLDTLLERPYGDMFWMYGCAGLYYATRDVLSPRYKQRIRRCWNTFTPYRGDTENHFLMYYGSLLLMSEAWPDLGGAAWFTGQSSKVIHAQALNYLNHWIDETVRKGQVEFNSPRYDYYYITPLVLLASYAKDDTFRRRCRMLLELELADYAVEYLDRSYCGAHSRVGDQSAIDPRSAEVTAYGDYFFGNAIEAVEPDVAFAALSDFDCPKVIRSIARDRSRPYFSRQRKQGRTTLRGSAVRNEVVFKRSAMTSDYCLGSMQGGIVQPIQQQSWSLVFRSAQPNNIITSLHPNVDADELGMFFPEEPSFMLERIGSTKAGYPSENKWVGASPAEHIKMTAHQLVDYYTIPSNAKYHHIDLFIPKNPDVTFVHGGPLSADEPWTILHCNATTVAIRLSAKPVWIDEGSHYRVRIYGDTVTLWLVVDSRTPDEAEYIRDLLSLAPTNTEEGLLFDDVRHFERITLDPRHPDKPDWAAVHDSTLLYDSPFMKSIVGSGIIKLRAEGDTLTLDFNKNREY